MKSPFIQIGETNENYKERLAAAIQTPLKDSLAFYHTSLKGLDQEQVEEKP